MEPNLTDRQKQILAYLKQHQREQGLMPSTREIQKNFGFSSQTAAMSHLRALEKKGMIQRLAGKARAVIFPGDLDREPLIDIPVYGHIPAGMSSDNQQEKQNTISIDACTLGISPNASAFALRVRGDSMIDAHIVSDDLVILEARQPRDHDIVAALIDGETTLKRYIVNRGKPFLKAENIDYPDLMPAHELVIQGVMVGLIRSKAA